MSWESESYDYSHFIVSPRVVRLLSTVWVIVLLLSTWVGAPIVFFYLWHMDSEANSSPTVCGAVGGECHGFLSLGAEFGLWSVHNTICPLSTTCGIDRSIVNTIAAATVNETTPSWYLGLGMAAPWEFESLLKHCGTFHGEYLLSFRWIILTGVTSAITTLLENTVGQRLKRLKGEWCATKKEKKPRAAARDQSLEDEETTTIGADYVAMHDEQNDDEEEQHVPLELRLRKPFEQTALLGVICTLSLIVALALAVRSVVHNGAEGSSGWDYYTQLGVIIFNGTPMKTAVKFGVLIVMQPAMRGWRDVDAQLGNRWTWNPFVHMRIIFVCGREFSWRITRTIFSSISYICGFQCGATKRQSAEHAILPAGLVFLAITSLLGCPWFFTHFVVGLVIFFPFVVLVLGWFLAVFFGAFYCFSLLTSCIRLSSDAGAEEPEYHPGCFTAVFNFWRNSATLISVTVLGQYLWSLTVNLAVMYYAGHLHDGYAFTVFTELFLRSPGCYELSQWIPKISNLDTALDRVDTILGMV
jgi:hypothetical protein